MHEAGLEMLDLPTMRKMASVRPQARLPGSALHTHQGDSWCHFGYSEGGRTAIDLRSGQVVWESSEPAAYGSTVFDGAAAYSSANGLSAYDLTTGRRTWFIELQDVSSAPSIDSGRVYVATAEGLVQVVDAVTGDLVGIHRFEYEDSGLGFEPSPVVPCDGSRIVVGTRREIICLETS